MAYKSKAQVDQENGAAAAIGILLLLCAAFIVAPGVCLVSATTALLSLTIDRGQAWTFGVLASVVVYVLLRVGLKDSGRANKGYLMICAGLAATLIVAHFGFHAEWPRAIYDQFIEGQSAPR